MKPKQLTKMQLSKIEEMVATGRLRTESIDADKAARFILQAQQAVIELSSMKVAHMKYDAAYNVCHDIGEALFAAYGYRAGTGDGSHIALGQFMTFIIERHPAAEAVEDFDSLRQVRNSLRYRASPISKSEADFAENVAQTLISEALFILGTE